MRLIDLAKKDISFEPSDWAWEAGDTTEEEDMSSLSLMNPNDPWLGSY
jgi:hypothetical protein